MKCTYSTQAYQWHDGDQHHVGVMVMHRTKTIESERGITSFNDSDDLVLMAHSHTRELEFVRYGDLKPYPSEPITNP
jgi:hypothetical protein